MLRMRLNMARWSWAEVWQLICENFVGRFVMFQYLLPALRIAQLMQTCFHVGNVASPKAQEPQSAR